MKTTVILKLGSTIPSLAHELGDFDEWIRSPLADLGLPMEVVDPRSAAPLPRLDTLEGVILTGSHSMVTDNLAWSERIAAWLPDVVARGIPLLGICYGHQLLARAMGGDVADNPHGREFGSHRVNLLPHAADDPLLGSFTPAIGAHLCHTQSVVRLPPDAVRLAWSEREPHQAYRVGSCAWGVQFHPEFGEQAMKGYIRECAGLLSGEGQDPAALERKVVPTPAGTGILRRFMEIVKERGESS